MKINQYLLAFIFLIIATTLEAFGDALIRKTIYEYTGTYRVVCTIIGALLLFGYGYTLNLAPVEFGKIVGLYIATLFIVWQVVNFITFRSLPSASTLVGGTLIVTGGLVVTFGKF